jgi:integrase
LFVGVPLAEEGNSMGTSNGHVYWDEQAGFWVGTVELERGLDGKRRKKRVRAKTEKEAKLRLRRVNEALAEGKNVVSTRGSTKAWLEWWSSGPLLREVQASTAVDYQNVLRYYVIPHIGAVPLDKLSPLHVEHMMQELEAQGLAPRTVARARTTLRRALSQAQKYGRVERNVAELVDAPRAGGHKTSDALSAAEAEAVMEAAHGDRLEALAVLVLMVGLRKGEALALRWDDIDLKAGTLKVRESKTKSGIRSVALPSRVVAALREHGKRQRRERVASTFWGDPELVFTSTIGTELDGRNVLRWWHELTIRAGVGRRRFHASRHTAATLMLNAGVPLEVVSKTLGHAGLAITSDIYAKVGTKLQRQAAEAMDELFS